jgi:hypothetical protein
MTDRELMQQALDALEKHVLEYETIEALRARLAQPEREWQGLTDEEVRDLWSWAMTAEAERTANTQQHAFARAIEANLKEKNHGG